MNFTLVQQKAKTIRLLILDVDGVMTSGHIYYGADNLELKGFHVHDGLGIEWLQKTGVDVAIISAKKSAATLHRAQILKIKHVYLGNSHKLPAYEELKQTLNLQDEQIAYMGDDLPDLPLLRRAGLAITVPQAPYIIQQHAHLITEIKAGDGAVREVCQFIMEAQHTYDAIIESYQI